MVTVITREQARDIEERYSKHYAKTSYNLRYIEDNIKCKYNISSIKECIGRLDELDLTQELLMFKRILQSSISNYDPKKVLIVYFAIKDFIRSKRLELLYELRDKGILYCMDKYPHWRIKDTIMNTKWKYMNKSFNPSNPVVDQYGDIEYKNIKAASKASGSSVENLKIILVMRINGLIYQTTHNSKLPSYSCK